MSADPKLVQIVDAALSNIPMGQSLRKDMRNQLLSLPADKLAEVIYAMEEGLEANTIAALGPGGELISQSELKWKADVLVVFKSVLQFQQSNLNKE